VFTIKNYVMAETIEEAYRLLQAGKSNTILGGCAFLKLGSKRIGTAIDLSKLDLDFIIETEEAIEIGAMTTFRAVETNEALNKYFSGIIPKAVGGILGIQFRNVVTVGASVYSRYGFSDFLTALLVLETEVELFNAGRMTLDSFLKKGAPRDILTKIIINKSEATASYQMMRNSIADYPLLNVAISKSTEGFRIVVGARPQRAELAAEASELLSSAKEINEEVIQAVVTAAIKELAFGSNMRGSREYRQAICKGLIARGIKEVLQ